jgi:hypothetical protein
VAEALAHDVPAPVITLALIQRLRSRRSPDNYTDRVLAALRNEFGGWGQSEDLRRTRESGFDFHLVKPVSFEAVTDVMRAWPMLPAGA